MSSTALPYSYKPSSPADCALLLTIPLDKAGFFADLKNPVKDFIKHFQRDRANQTDESLWLAYEPYAVLAADVCDRVSKQGVRVIERATLNDFGRALTTGGVTTLVAHWRSALFRPEDIVSPEQVAAYLCDEANAHDCPNLCRTLNTCLKAADKRFDDVLPGSFGEAVAKQQKWHARRVELEQNLHGAVKGGAAIEFSEGLVGVSDVLSRCPADFTGVLDLTVCQSVLFAEQVRAKCRQCVVLSAANLTSLDFRLALYAQIIDVLSRKAEVYEHAVTKIRSALIQRYSATRARYRSANRS